MAGPGYKAAKAMVRDDDRISIHSNLGGALNSLVGVRGAQISDMSETFARTRREEAAALREARLDGTYRGLGHRARVYGRRRVLADGLKSLKDLDGEVADGPGTLAQASRREGRRAGAPIASTPRRRRPTEFDAGADVPLPGGGADGFEWCAGVLADDARAESAAS